MPPGAAGARPAAAAAPEGGPRAPRVPPKLHRDLARDLEQAAGGPVRFLVRLGEQADARHAATRARAEAGAGSGPAAAGQVRRAVVQALRSTAERTQGPVLALIRQLQAQGHVQEARPLWVLNAIAVTGDQVAASRLAERAEVESLSPDRRVPLSLPAGAAPASAPAALPWNLELIGAPRAWAAGADGTGVVIASLDTGVDWTHPALRERFRGYDPANPSQPRTEGNWLDVVNGRAAPYDEDGHGTHTTATAVGVDPASGQRVGVAPGARWIAVKAFDRDGAYNSWLLQAGQWLLAPTDAAGTPRPEWAPDVITNSWGGPGVDEFFRTMVQNWRAAGILPVFAAGNSGPGAGTVENPGNYPESLAVAAVDSSRALASFSSRGPSPYPGVQKPNLSAPGVAIYSALPGGAYGYRSGTSMAAPHVSGTAALMLSVAPQLTVAELEQALTATATPLTDAAYPAVPNDGYGAGLVNAAAAVALVTGPATGTVSGAVTDAVTGAPLAATLTLDPPGTRTASAATDGRYSLGAPAGSYTLAARAYGYEPAAYPVTITAGQETIQDIALTPLPRGTLQGRVVDPATGQPVSGARVTVAEDLAVAAAVTGADGFYRVQPYPGSYTLRVEAPGYRTAHRPVTVLASALATIEVPLARGPAGDCPVDRCAPERTGTGGNPGLPPYLPAWTSAVTPPLDQEPRAQPVIAGGRVFTGDAADGSLVALNLFTGEALWRRRLEPDGTAGVAGSPAYGDGSVFAASGSGRLHALAAADGTPLWQVPLGPGKPDSAPVYAGGRVYISAQGALYALDAASGRTLWRHAIPNGTPAVAVGGGRVYATNGERTWALDAATGSPLWEAVAWCSCAAAGQPRQVAYAAGTLLVKPGSTGYLLALDAARGFVRWAVPADGIPAAGDGVAYVYTGGQVHALDLQTGAVRWRLPLAVNAPHLPPVLAGKLLFLGAATAVDVEARQAAWNYSGGSGLAPVPGEGFLLLTDPQQGRLLALQSQGNVTVSFTLQGQSHAAGTAVTLAGGGRTDAGTTDAAGQVTFTGVAPGTYTLMAVHPPYLRHVEVITVGAASLTLGPWQLALGDVNQDGAIGGPDLEAVASGYGEAGSGPDLTGDGRVDLADLAAVARNWGRRHP